MTLGSAPDLPGLQYPFLFSERAGHGSVTDGLSGWNELGALPSLEMCDSVTLKFPPSGSVVELARLSFGWMGSGEYFLSPLSFCSSSHPRRALSGRTSMSGPNACGFEHHSA